MLLHRCDCMLFVLMLQLVLQIGRASQEYFRVTIVTALHEWQLASMNYTYVDNFVNFAKSRNVVIFGDAKSIYLLQDRYPNTPTRWTFVRYSEDKLDVMKLLKQDKSKDTRQKYNKETLHAIQKIFFIDAAKKFISTSCYAWIELDSITSSNYLPLFIGFPDKRKIRHSMHKIVGITNRIAVDVMDYTDSPGSEVLQYNVIVPRETILIGGVEAWMSVRIRCEELLASTIDSGKSAIQYWLEKLSLSQHAAHQLRYTLSERQLFWITLYNAALQYFCQFEGQNIIYGGNLLDSGMYVLFQYSAHSDASSDLRCTDEALFELSKASNMRDFSVLEL